MICKKCGRENIHNFKYCVYCGYKIKRIHFLRFFFIILILFFISFYFYKIYLEIYSYSDIKVREKVVFDYTKSDIDFKKYNMLSYDQKRTLDIKLFQLPIGKAKKTEYKKDLFDYNISLKKDGTIDYYFIGQFPINNKTKIINLFLQNNNINEKIDLASKSFFIKDDNYTLRYNLDNNSRDLFKNFKLIEKNIDLNNIFIFNRDIYFELIDKNNITHLYKNFRKVSDGNNVKDFFYSEFHKDILVIYDNYIKLINGKKIIDLTNKRDELYVKIFLDKYYKNEYKIIKYNNYIGGYKKNYKIFKEIKSKNKEYLCVIFGNEIFFNKKAIDDFEILKYKESKRLYINEDSFVFFNKNFTYLLKNFEKYEIPKYLNYMPFEVTKDLNNYFYYDKYKYKEKSDKSYIYSINSNNSNLFYAKEVFEIPKNENSYKKRNILDVKKYKEKDFIVLLKDEYNNLKIFINDQFIFKQKNIKDAQFELVDGDNYGLYFRSTYNVMDQWYYFINGKKEKNSFKEIEKLKFNNKNDYIYSAQIKEKWHFVLNGEIIERGYDFINYVKYIEEKDSFYAFACDDDKLYLVEIPIKRNEKVTKK